MKKLMFFSTALLLIMLVFPAAVAADAPDDAVTVSVAGDGAWLDDCLLVSLFPGEAKCFLVDVHSNLDVPILVTVQTIPGCVQGQNLTACFCPDEATLPASGDVTFNLTITASGTAPPGVFSVDLLIETDTEIPDPDPDPEPGVPHHMTIAVSHATRVAGVAHELVATVFDEGSEPVPDVPVDWTILSGDAAFSSVAINVTTDANGRAAATAQSDTVGTVVVQCSAGSGVEATTTLVWVAAADDGNGDEPAVVSSGLPAWAVFLIFIGVMGGGLGGYALFKRWRARRAVTVDPLAAALGEEPDELPLE